MSLSRAGSSNTLSWRIISSAHDLFHSAQNFPIYAQKIRHGSFFLPCIFAIRIFFHFFPPTFLEKLVHTLFILFSELPSYISVDTIPTFFVFLKVTNSWKYYGFSRTFSWTKSLCPKFFICNSDFTPYFEVK